MSREWRTLCLCLHFTDEHDERGVCTVKDCGCSQPYAFEVTPEQMLAWYKSKWDVNGENDRL